MNVTIGELLRSRAVLSGQEEAAVCNGQRFTFNELNQRANRFAGYLADQGFSRGDRVAICCKNSETVVTALLGAGKLGAITVLLNWRLQPRELGYILRNSGARLLVHDAEFDETVDAIIPDASFDSVLRVDRSDADNDFEQVLAAHPDSEPGIAVSDDDVVALMYTSGTTGHPKGVKLTHRALLSAAQNCAFTIDWPRQGRYLTIAPMFHIAGLMPVFANLYCTCSCVYLPDFHPVDVWDTIEQERISHFLAVPQMLAMMAQAPGIEQRDLSALVFAVSGASAVPASLIRQYASLGIDVYQVYGATECSGSATFWMPHMGEDSIRTVGRPVLHSHIRVLDPGTGAELPVGEVGEVCFAGPQVFAGYWDNDNATRGAIVDGFYRTGDLGFLDEAGCLTIVDRLKDMIISGGENVYPAEIEAVLAEHPAVMEVAVLGQPDAKWGEVPVAFVVQRPEVHLTAAVLVDYCRANLAGFKAIKGVRFVETLPRNASSKLLKRELKQQLDAEPIHLD